MIITQDFIFLQLQKTGSTHIRRLIQHFYPDEEQGGKHYRLPKGYDPGSRVIWGSVRNPWDWYLSYWTFSCQQNGGIYTNTTQSHSVYRAIRKDRTKYINADYKPGPKDFFNILCSEVSRPVKRWSALYKDVENPSLFREWLKLIINGERTYDAFSDYGHSTISAFSGLYTYLYLLLFLKDSRHLFDNTITDIRSLRYTANRDNLLNCTIRMENLEFDFLQALEKSGHKTTAADRDYVLNQKKVNTSNRPFDKDYYFDQQSIDLIAEKDSFLISKYEYDY